MTAFSGVDKLSEVSRQESLRWQPTEVPRYVTLSQFCEATQISNTIARMMISEGRLRAFSHNGGHDFRIEVSEISRVLVPVPPKAPGRPKAVFARGGVQAKTTKEQGAQ
jgi:hypothetical protein